MVPRLQLPANFEAHRRWRDDEEVDEVCPPAVLDLPNSFAEQYRDSFQVFR